MKSNLYTRVVKRALDLTGGVVLLVLTAPVQLACNLWVLLDDGPPVYYRQQRAGLNGEQFAIIKLRTMRNGTEARFGGYPTADAVTRSGRVLRKLSLDELPQLINVLRGEMSFVGPRPALADQVRRYTDEQRQRLLVRPGVTGLAQVRYRNDARWSERIRADIEYIEHISFRSDLAILLQTLPAVLRSQGQIVGQTPGDVDDLGPHLGEAPDV